LKFGKTQFIKGHVLVAWQQRDIIRKIANPPGGDELSWYGEGTGKSEKPKKRIDRVSDLLGEANG